MKSRFNQPRTCGDNAENKMSNTKLYGTVTQKTEVNTTAREARACCGAPSIPDSQTTVVVELHGYSTEEFEGSSAVGGSGFGSVVLHVNGRYTSSSLLGGIRAGDQVTLGLESKLDPILEPKKDRAKVDVRKASDSD